MQSAPLDAASLATFAQSLTGSVLLYNVSGQPQESMSPAFGLWSRLEVRTKVYVHHNQYYYSMSSMESRNAESDPFLGYLYHSTTRRRDRAHDLLVILRQLAYVDLSNFGRQSDGVNGPWA